MSIGAMSCSRIDCRWLGLSRLARMPPCTLGCSVFTRPSIIPGKPVCSATSVTTTPFSLRSCAVPPVERICTPCVSSARASSTTPVLSETLMRARWTFIVLSSRRRPGSNHWAPAFAGVTCRLIQPVLLQLLAEGIAVQAEQLRGAGLVALGLEHHDLEHRLLDGADHHVIDARRLLPVEVLEVLAHHLAHRRGKLVLPSGVRSRVGFVPRLQVPPRRRIRVVPNARAARRRTTLRRRAAIRRSRGCSFLPGTRRSS